MNTLGNDIVQFITQTLKSGGAGEPFEAFVISNDAANFSVGANLMLLLMSVQEQEWDDVDLAIRQFQGMTQAIKFSPRPVVIAPFGMTLGGGTEALHARGGGPPAPCRELYMGLVEVGRGSAPGARRMQAKCCCGRGQSERRGDSSRRTGRVGRDDGSHEKSV